MAFEHVESQPETGFRVSNGEKGLRLTRYLMLAAAAAGLCLYAAGLIALWHQLAKILPDQISLSLLHRTITVHHVHQKISDNGLLLFLIIPLVFAGEAVITGWQNSSVRRVLFARSASVRMDIAQVVADQLQVLTLLRKVLTFGITVSFGAWINAALSFALHVQIGLAFLPAWAQVFFYFWAATFFDYWTHRLDHSKLFWPLHRYHHSASEFCAITSLRSHPANFTGQVCINLPMAILGAPIDVMISVNLIVTVIGLLIHSNIDSNWGWFGRWVIQSPNHHRLHHILDYRSNGVGHYAMAPIWDHMFGTWKGEADQSLAIGVEEPCRQGYWFMPDLMRDYIDFWKGFARPVLRRLRAKPSAS